MPEWTEQQRKAITMHESNLLVSAAAGSGKTAVLVERIIRRIVDERMDIDRILVVTFTKAAAAQMKQRIADALEVLLAEDPVNEHLQRQSTLVHLAPISTIDSFCLNVVREHIHMTQLDPDFRVADPGEVKLLSRDVLSQLLEDKYAGKDPAFLRLADNFEPDIREGELGENVLKLYEFSQAHPWPEEWRAQSVCLYEADTPDALEQQPWVRDMVSYIRALARDAVHQLESCCPALDAAEVIPAGSYEEIIAGDWAYLKGIAGAENYQSLYQAAAARDSWPTIRKKKGDDPDAYARAKAVRDDIKKQFKDKIIPAYLSLDVDQLCSLVKLSAPAAYALKELTDEFAQRFVQAKRDRSIVDFSDIEHCALEILTEHTDQGIRPSTAAAAYASQFDEIMIDEYQDSNLVQETLLSVISGECHDAVPNRFMVGDVKQSIYRFRQAMPELFIDKYHEYGDPSQHVGRRIELFHNFRSRTHVIEGINMIFRQLMREDLGGVLYDEDAALHPGADYPAGGDKNFHTNEVWLTMPDEVDETQTDPAAGQEMEMAEESGETVSDGQDMFALEDMLTPEEISDDVREARITARRIAHMIGRDKIWDSGKKAYRPVRFGDIAILLRAAAGHAEVFLKELTDAGIPAYSGSGTGYFSALEVRTVLAYLAVIDNPLQDIPLAAVLRSPMGGFTDEEIARIHIDGEGTWLWDKLMSLRTAEGDTAIDHFVDRTLVLRDLSREASIHELIWRLIDGTSYLDYVSAMPGGDQRRANLNMLVEKAVAFENGSYRGLFHFLRYVEQLKKYEIDYGEAPLASSDEGSVQIMSIHKSKGLEFPVVFVCGMGRGFNTRDAAGSLICHEGLGIGISVIDPERHVKLTSPIRAAIGRRCLTDARGEELRVLYVALTRAKEKLILVGSGCSETDIKRWQAGVQDQSGFLPFTARDQARRPLDLLMSALLSHKSANDFRSQAGLPPADPCGRAFADGCGFEIRVVHALSQDALLEEPVVCEEKEERAQDLFRIDPDKVYDPALAGHLHDLLNKHYVSEGEGYIPAKVSVSYLKEEGYEQEQERIYQLLPAQEEGQTVTAASTMTAAERGTLVHTFMQYLDYDALHKGSGFEMQLECMVKCGKIADSDRKELIEDSFHAFFESSLCRRMGQAAEKGMLFREQPFVIGESARELKAQWDSDETVLVQGIIDAWFVEDDQIIVVDYKTDRVPDGDPQSLVRKYQTQLRQYASALERLTGKTVRERLIWSFALGSQIECP